MCIESEIERQTLVAKWIDENLSTSYQLEGKSELLSHPCFDSVVENHAAILLLAKSKLYGSMLALIRVEFEAVVRGVWLYHIADESELSKYEKDKLKIHFGDMVQAVELGAGMDSGVLSKIKNEHWAIFNSFTHTGYQSIARRVGSSSTGYDNYELEEIEKALNYTGLFAIIAAIELSALTKDENTQKRALEFSRAYIEKKL